jgi:hypothetical protein
MVSSADGMATPWQTNPCINDRVETMCGKKKKRKEKKEWEVAPLAPGLQV